MAAAAAERTNCKYHKHGCAATFGAGDVQGAAEHELNAWRSHMSLLELKVKNLALTRKQTTAALQAARERCHAAEIEETKSRTENERLRDVVRQLQAQVHAHQHQHQHQHQQPPPQSGTTHTTITTTTTSSTPLLPSAGGGAEAKASETVRVHAHAHARAAANSRSPTRRPFDDAVLGVAAKELTALHESPTLRGTAGGASASFDALPHSAKPKTAAAAGGPYGLPPNTTTGVPGGGTGAQPYAFFVGARPTADPSIGTRQLQQARIRKLSSNIEYLTASLHNKQHELEALKASVHNAQHSNNTALATASPGALTAVASSSRGSGARSASPSAASTTSSSSSSSSSAARTGFWAISTSRLSRRRAAEQEQQVAAAAASSADTGGGAANPASSLSKLQRVRATKPAAAPGVVAATNAAVAVASASLNPHAFGAGAADADGLMRDALVAARDDPHPVLQRWAHGDAVMYVYKDANAVGSYSGPHGEYVQGVDSHAARGFIMCAKEDEARVMAHMARTRDWDNEHDVAATFAAVQNENIGLSSYSLDESIQQLREERARNAPKPFVQRWLCGNEWLKWAKNAPQRYAQGSAQQQQPKPQPAAASQQRDE